MNVSKYENLVKDIIKNVGGKENVISLTHCITRLRFQLKDESRANDTVLKNMDGVVTVMHGGGQYQVVIGKGDVYDEALAQLGIASGSMEAVEEKKKGVGAFLIDFISNVMGPNINILCASGMIKGILAIAIFFGLTTAESGIYQLLNAIGDALFYFFPIFLGMTTAKKLKIDPFIGLVLGAGLVYPTIQGVDLNVFGFTVNSSYQSTILPVIFTVVFASFLYKPLLKVVPDVIKAFFVPMIVMMISLPVGFVVIGPIMNGVSEALGQFITAGYNISPILAGALIGSLYQVMVLFGVHSALGAVCFLQIASGQPSFLGFMVGTTFTQTITVFAIWLKTKDKKLKEVAFPAMISGIFGVTEPAVYGVTLPRIKFFIISCIGAGMTGAYLGATDTQLWQLTGLGIFTIPGFIGGTVAVSTILFHVIISLVIGCAFSFIATFILYKDDAVVEQKEAQVETKAVSANDSNKCFVKTPISGNVLPLSEAKDDAFALGVLGDGVVIEPTEGKLYAPVDGTISVLFPSLHAIGLTSDNGVELLMHVGIDTVQLEGNGFTAHVKQGDQVKQGQLLLDIDLDAIVNAGYSTQTPVIITNVDDLLEIVKTDKEKANKEDILLTAII